jgi:hypothetical protein
MKLAPAEALRRDLALVLPGGEVRAFDGAPTRATIDGRETSVADAVAHAAKLIEACRAPAVVGLNHLTIEAIREAIALAETLRGKLLPDGEVDPAIARQSVTQAGSLGHTMSSQMIVWVGCNGGDGPIANTIAERQLLGGFVDAELETVLRLRDELRKPDSTGPFGPHKRVTVVLKTGCDPRVASQWHKLATDVQKRVRVSVFQLPPPDGANARGVIETITWQTGVSPTWAGGVDFADGSQRACGTDRDGLDLLITAGAAEPGIRVGPLGRSGAVSFSTPGLCSGLAARVMRCDGVVLWLCEDPAAAPPDPAVEVLRALREFRGKIGGGA